MEILWLLVPLSLFIVLLIGVAFWWSVRSGQFDDLDGPAYRILADDDVLADGQEKAVQDQQKNKQDDLEEGRDPGSSRHL